MSITIASQLIIILLSLYFIFRALRKMPKPIMITVWSIIGILTVAIFIAGFYYPEKLMQINESVEGFKDRIQGQ